MMMDDNMTIIDDNSPYIRYTLWKPHLAEPLLLEHLFISIFSIPNIHLDLLSIPAIHLEILWVESMHSWIHWEARWLYFS